MADSRSHRNLPQSGGKWRKMRFTDKQRVAYWKKKYLSCKRTHDNLLRRMKDW